MKNNTLPCQVILLPTKEKSILSINVDKVGYNLKDKEYYNNFKNYQHLYFISNEPIKEGDYFITKDNNGYCVVDLYI